MAQLQRGSAPMDAHHPEQDDANAFYRRWQKMVASLPPTIEPFYRHNRSDQTIGLYRGRIRLQYSQWFRELSGVVTVEWRPTPTIFYQATTVGMVNPTQLFQEFQEE